jgi:hypothetical protein
MPAHRLGETGREIQVMTDRKHGRAAAGPPPWSAGGLFCEVQFANLSGLRVFVNEHTDTLHRAKARWLV